MALTADLASARRRPVVGGTGRLGNPFQNPPSYESIAGTPRRAYNDTHMSIQATGTSTWPTCRLWQCRQLSQSRRLAGEEVDPVLAPRAQRCSITVSLAGGPDRLRKTPIEVVSSLGSWPYGKGGESHSAAQAARSVFITATNSLRLPS